MEISKAILLKKIQRSFPNINWKVAKQIVKGYDHYVIILDNSIVFRFPKKTYFKKLLKGEVELLKIFAKNISISIPEYCYIAPDYSVAGYTIIKGDGLKVKRYNSLSSIQKNKLAKQIAEFLTAIHSVPFSKVKHCNIRERFPEKELKQLYKDAKKYLYHHFSQKEKDVFENFFLDLNKAFEYKYKKVLVHGDFSGDNMILNIKNNLTGVIDFSDRAFHDPAFDLVYLWEFGRVFVESIYKYYGGSKIGILERSKVYAQASAVWNMVESRKRITPEYNLWYRRFKKINSQI